MEWLSTDEVKEIFDDTSINKIAMIKYDSHLKKIFRKWLDTELEIKNINEMKKWYITDNKEDNVANIFKK